MVFRKGETNQGGMDFSLCGWTWPFSRSSSLHSVGMVPSGSGASPSSSCFLSPSSVSISVLCCPSFLLFSRSPFSLSSSYHAPSPLTALLSSHSMCCSFPACSLLQVLREPASPPWARVEHSTELSFVNMFSKIPVFVVVCLISSLLCRL